MTDDATTGLGRDFVVVVCRPSQVEDVQKYWKDHGGMELVSQPTDRQTYVRAFLDTTNGNSPKIEGHGRHLLIFATKQAQTAKPADQEA
jgi:hypothetical protein